MAIAFPTKPASSTSTAQITPDLVDQLAVRVAALIEAGRWNEKASMKARQAGDTSEMANLRHQDQRLLEALLAAQGTASTMQATTLRGAMLQVMLASDQASHLWDYALADGSATNDDERAQAKLDSDQAYRRIEFCLYSVLSVLSQVSGIDPDSLGADYMMPAALDPHARVASAIAYSAEA
jgi:hypothetical protein